MVRSGGFQFGPYTFTWASRGLIPSYSRRAKTARLRGGFIAQTSSSVFLLGASLNSGPRAALVRSLLFVFRWYRATIVSAQ